MILRPVREDRQFLFYISVLSFKTLQSTAKFENNNLILDI